VQGRTRARKRVTNGETGRQRTRVGEGGGKQERRVVRTDVQGRVSLYAGIVIFSGKYAAVHMMPKL